ncbi:hypothetical protein OPV22_026775 [Ensete ventricosum]|uniref:Uncharacterized protein n=1 Tax=Ensete ventricosum TaxID=4639 RepID=A0AAV8Q3F8_ENSVE|nr:hypothetical protein OPV22_026775 [Ensete ventricosum]
MVADATRSNDSVKYLGNLLCNGGYGKKSNLCKRDSLRKGGLMMFAGEIDLSSTTGLRQSGQVEWEKARCLALQRLAEAAILLRDGGKIGGDYEAALRLKELDDGRGSRERRRRWLLRQMDPLAVDGGISSSARLCMYIERGLKGP